MAITYNINSFLFYAFFVFLTIGTEVSCSGLAKKPVRSNDGRHPVLFVFGDSFVDTGNLGNLGRDLTHAWYPPYGMTYPKKPTGRNSDGRVLTDFLASLLGIRSPLPYKDRRTRVSPVLIPYGMNFAVGGSGVFDTNYLQRNLSEQIGTFEAMINEGKFSKRDLEASVALVAISGNDYMTFLEDGGDIKNKTQAEDYIVRLKDAFALDIKRIHDLGVPKLVINSLPPLDCSPFITRNSSYAGCNPAVNAAVRYHNALLNAEVMGLNLHSNNIRKNTYLFLDVEAAFRHIIEQDTPGSRARTFEQRYRPCCDGKTTDTACGQVDEKGVAQYTLCRDPSSHVYWDLVHPTQAGWAAVFQYLKAPLRQFLSL